MSYVAANLIWVMSLQWAWWHMLMAVCLSS